MDSLEEVAFTELSVDDGSVGDAESDVDVVVVLADAVRPCGCRGYHDDDVHLFA